MMNEDLAESSLMCEESAWEGRLARPVSDNRWSELISQNEHLQLVLAFTIVSRATNYGLRGGIFVFVCIFGHLEKKGDG